MCWDCIGTRSGRRCTEASAVTVSCNRVVPPHVLTDGRVLVFSHAPGRRTALVSSPFRGPGQGNLGGLLVVSLRLHGSLSEVDRWQVRVCTLSILVGRRHH